MTLPSLILMPLISFSRGYESGQFDIGTGLYSYKNECQIVNLYSGAFATNQNDNLVFANGYMDIDFTLYFNNQNDYAIVFEEVSFYWLANEDVVFTDSQSIPSYFELEDNHTIVQNVFYSNSMIYNSNFGFNTRWVVDTDLEDRPFLTLNIDMYYQNPDGVFTVFSVFSNDYFGSLPADTDILHTINGNVAINKDYMMRTINENILLLLDSNSSYIAGFNDGYNEGETNGYSRGYSVGFDEGFNSDTVATTIFNGILYIGLLPINVFLACFNFEILGINMSSFVTALLSVCFVVIIFRFLFNGKSGD